MTDLGQIAVYEVDAANPQQPVRLLAGQEAERDNAAADPVCIRRQPPVDRGPALRACWRCKGPLQQLNRKWTANQDDVFMGPLAVQGDMLVHVRRRPGGAAVLVEGAGADDGQAAVDDASGLADRRPGGQREPQGRRCADGRGPAVLARGRAAACRLCRCADRLFRRRAAVLAILPEASLSQDQSQLIWTEAAARRARLWVQRGHGEPRRPRPRCPRVRKPPRAAQPLGQPLARAADQRQRRAAGLGGRIRRTALCAAAPARARCRSGRGPRSIPAATALLISDGRGTIYSSCSKRSRSRIWRRRVEPDRVVRWFRRWCWRVRPYFGVLQRDSGDALAGFDGQGQPAFEPVALPGRCQAGPFAAGGLVLVAAEPDGPALF